MAIPDVPLTQAQIDAFEAAKTYAASKGITITITVVK